MGNASSSRKKSKRERDEYVDVSHDEREFYQNELARQEMELERAGDMIAHLQGGAKKKKPKKKTAPKKKKAAPKKKKCPKGQARSRATGRCHKKA